MSSTTSQITTAGYAHEASGNMTNDGDNTLVYDAENRVTGSSGSNGSGAYSYDGNGLRVQKVAGSTTTVYIYSGAKVIAEYVNGALPTSPAREYVYAGGALLASISGATTTYYHQDHLSNRLVTDSTGAAVENLGAYPYGESWYNTSSEKWLYTSYERDGESGNDYAQARYYVNRFGRFLSTDPLSGSATDPQSLNHYGYTENDPVNAADPSGMVTVPLLYFFGGFGGGGMDGECTEDGVDAYCGSLGGIISSGGAASFSVGTGSLFAEQGHGQGFDLGTLNEFSAIIQPAQQWDVEDVLDPGVPGGIAIEGTLSEPLPGNVNMDILLVGSAGNANGSGNATPLGWPLPRANAVNDEFIEYCRCVAAAQKQFASDAQAASDAADYVDALHPSTPLPQPDPYETPDPPHAVDGSGWAALFSGWWAKHKRDRAMKACANEYSLAALHQ